MQDEINRLLALINGHLVHRPGIQPRDVYKLLYQGVRGPEHIITSPQAFTDRLKEEWEGLDLTGQDPLYELIRPDGRLLRINLRPYKAAGGQPEALAAACLETGQRRWGSQAELVHTWEAFVAACETHPQPGLAWEDLTAFTLWLAGQGYPPIHHSESYCQLYRPAYRLVAAELGALNNLG